LAIFRTWSKPLYQNNLKKDRYRVQVLKERCKGCSFCIDFCPQHTLVRSHEINSRGYHVVFQDSNVRCSGCGICTMVCPEFAIHVEPVGENDKAVEEAGA